MYTLDNKIHYTFEDFEDTIEFFGKNVLPALGDVELFSIYQGSLSICHRLSKQYNLSHSILKFQRMDGDDLKPSLLHLDRKNGSFANKNLLIVDDVFDSGITILECERALMQMFPVSRILSFTIFKRDDNHLANEMDLLYQHIFDGTWIQFEPWEGK